MAKTETVKIDFSGIPLVLPDTPEIKRIFRCYTYDNFPVNFCGAGKGIGELLVPDYILGFTRFFKWVGLDYSIKISPACAGHDEDWLIAEPTWEAFKEANERFEENIEAIIDCKARNEWMKAQAMYRAITYSNAVTLHGEDIFWTMKSKQGHSLPSEIKKNHYKPYIRDQLDQLFMMRGIK